MGLTTDWPFCGDRNLVFSVMVIQLYKTVKILQHEQLRSTHCKSAP